MAVVGSLILERFRIEEHLGTGSFGSVHRAWDVRLQRHVAIKAIPSPNGENAFVMREAQAAARLAHPSIVTLYELGYAADTAYLVTELVEGQTLREAIEEGDLSDREIAEIGADLCEALDHAHDRGVIHRDLKPSNILISEPEGLAKLMDFGVASLGDEAGLTAPGDVVGTLAYMSPEQADGAGVGPESDLYSLCLVLYECFSGINPNRRRSPAATVRAIGTRPQPLARLRPDLPIELCEAIDAGLEPDPETRIGIGELGHLLEDCLGMLSARADHASARRGDREILGGAWLTGRVGYGAGVLAAVALAVGIGRPGLAVLTAIVCLPPALLCRSEGGWVWIGLSAPLLGLVGLGTLYPALAGLLPSWRDRIVMALCGLGITATAQVASGRDLGLSVQFQAAEGWSRSASSALTEFVVPLVTDPQLLANAAVWIGAALLVGLILAPLRAWTGRRAMSRRMGEGSIDVEPEARTPLSRSR